MVSANWGQKRLYRTICAVTTFWKVFYESWTRILQGKIKSSANWRFPPFRVSVHWRENCIIINAYFPRNLKSLKKWLAASVLNYRN